MHYANLLKIFQPYSCDDLLRLGKDHDGGYLVSLSDIKKSTQLLSFGIGSDISFEAAFTALNSCTVNAYDSSAEEHNFFSYDKHNLFLHNINSSNILNIDITDNTFIKCDIEGDEYNIFNYLINNSHKLSGMVIEVHNINQPDNFNLLLNFISKVNLKLVHVHVNNYFYYKTERGNIPDILELSFTSNESAVYDPSIELPHILDMTNNPNDEEFKLVF